MWPLERKVGSRNMKNAVQSCRQISCSNSFEHGKYLLDGFQQLRHISSDSGSSTFFQRDSPSPPPWRLLPESLFYSNDTVPHQICITIGLFWFFACFPDFIAKIVLCG